MYVPLVVLSALIATYRVANILTLPLAVTLIVHRIMLWQQ